MAGRKQNERRFGHWVDLPDGGRRYWRYVSGQESGYARYVKVVDANEVTLTIVQEIYNDDSKLVAVHQKYPEDTGHQWLDLEDDAT